MTPEYARGRAAEMQKLAGDMQNVAGNKKQPSSVRYRAAVIMEQAAEAARMFEKLECLLGGKNV